MLFEGAVFLASLARYHGGIQHDLSPFVLLLLYVRGREGRAVVVCAVDDHTVSLHVHWLVFTRLGRVNRGVLRTAVFCGLLVATLSITLIPTLVVTLRRFATSLLPRRWGLGLVLKQRPIDVFGRLSTPCQINQPVCRQREPSINQDGIDGVVGGCVPVVWITFPTPQVVLEHHMADLVGDHAFEVSVAVLGDKRRVEQDAFAIGRHRVELVGLDKVKTHGDVTKKRVVQK